MSLNIKIKQENTIVHSKSFSAFVHFNDKKNRLARIKEMRPENITNFYTYTQFVEMAVEKSKQKFFMELVNKSKPISVTIW